MADNDLVDNGEVEQAVLRDENAQLKEELARLRSLFDRLPLGLYQVTPQGEVTLANAPAREIFDRSSGEILPLASRLRKNATIPGAGSGSAGKDEGILGYEAQWNDANGRTLHIRENTRVFRNPDGTARYYECTLEDITERRQAEAALRSSEERYRLVVEHSPAGILLVDDDYGVVYANPEVGRILGRRPDKIMGARFTDFLHPDSVGTVAQRYADRQQGKQVPSRYETWILQADNTPRLAALSVASFHTSGGAARTVAQILDITDRTHAERALRDYTQTLETRNAELDAFADTVAHDLKNPLATIIGFAEALVETMDDLTEDDIRRILSSISGMGRKMDNIIEELLLFARIRQTAVKPSPINMGITVQNALDRLDHMRVERDAQIEVPRHWPAALGHGPWIEEVWANYISNALTYGGTPPRIILGSESTEGGQIRFWVQDYGDGVDPSRHARLFDGSAAQDQGAAKGHHGLGLSIAKRIVSKLGGEVAMTSSGRPGEGSTFSFTLPAATHATSLDPTQ